MNKTISINLGGIVFNIEELAYHSLHSYLESIKAVLAGTAGQAEVLADVEARMAEILRQRMNETKNVIDQTDVDELIATMGQPSDFATGEPLVESTNLKNKNRRVYRDYEDAVVGGVCAGLSHYLSWDPLILRILAVIALIASFGSALLVYIVLWAVIPPARTTAEKLQMRGEPVNFENIRKHVKDELEGAAEKMKKAGRQFNRKAPHYAEDVFVTLGMFLSRVFGLLFLLLGLALLIGLTAGLIATDINLAGGGRLNFSLLDQLIFADAGSMSIALIGIIMLVGAPAIALLYNGSRLLFGIKQKIQALSWLLLSLFIAGVVLCTWQGVAVGRQFARSAENTVSIPIALSSDSVLYVDASPHPFATVQARCGDRDFTDLIQINDSSVIYGEPVNIRFRKAEDSDARVVVITSGQGPSAREAALNLDALKYNFQVDGNHLLFDAFFTTPSTTPYRGQEVDITIYIPEDTRVTFGPQTNALLPCREYAGRTVLFGRDGFED